MSSSTKKNELGRRSGAAAPSSGVDDDTTSFAGSVAVDRPTARPAGEEVGQEGKEDDEVIFTKARLPQGATFTMTTFRNTSVHLLRTQLANHLSVPTRSLLLLVCEDGVSRELDDPEVIGHFSATKQLELHLECVDREVELQAPVDWTRPLDVLSVQLDDGRTVVVEVERCNLGLRTFLGGLRCKKSGKEFYHATSQTPDRWDAQHQLKRSRHAQTLDTSGQQTVSEQSTQTADEGGREGRIMEARVDRGVEGARRAFFRWKDRVCKSSGQSESEVTLPEEPFKRTDALYQLVEGWRKRCLQHAFHSKTQGPSRADFQEILRMQVNMLAVIEVERVKEKEDKKREREIRLLEESCSPLKWKRWDGKELSMATIKSQRASELKQLHDQLFSVGLPPEKLKQRLELVRDWMLSSGEEKKGEMVQLLDRELQMLEMGVGAEHLSHLHLRLQKLFADLIRDPSETKKAEQKFYLCGRCKKMLPPKNLVIGLGRPEMKVCSCCQWLDNSSHQRVDYNPFSLMLKQLQQGEARAGCYRSWAFLLQVVDLRYLVHHIWHGQSAISQSSLELRLGRWDNAQEWSPWNTVLLTNKELQQHVRVTDLFSVYGEEFIKNVLIKHLIAKIHFKGLQKLN